MASERITITLPEPLARDLRKKARESRLSVSRVVAEALQKQKQDEIREKMIAGYKEAAALNKELAEEFWPIAAEAWPVD